jgi:hypothetical protein
MDSLPGLPLGHQPASHGEAPACASSTTGFSPDFLLRTFRESSAPIIGPLAVPHVPSTASRFCLRFLF